MSPEEATRIAALLRGHGRTAQVGGVRYRQGLSGIRTSVAPAALASVEVGWWAEEQIGPSTVRRRWVDPTSAEGRRVAAAVSEPEPKPPKAPDPVIVITDRALEDMSRELFWSTREDGLESGGVLFGHVAGRVVTISRASGPGGRAERGTHRLLVDERMSGGWEIGEQVREVGLWHSHPPGDGRPSRTDRGAFVAGFARCMKETGLTAWCGLIFSDPEQTNWINPHVGGWVLDLAPNGDPRMTQADLKGGL